MSDGQWNALRASRLQWLPELAIGWYPVTAQPYDATYWENYRALDRTPTGARLTAMRCEFVAKHYAGAVVDIGIGGGRFVTARANAHGYDVNPCAVQWLKDRALWWNPYRDACDAVTFWDSLEHIHDPAPLLANVRRWVFVSAPIFKDCADVLRSKHYKPDEHCWYFSRDGIAHFMARLGFAEIARNDMEQSAGREQIESFAFHRIR